MIQQVLKAFDVVADVAAVDQSVMDVDGDGHGLLASGFRNFTEGYTRAAIGPGEHAGVGEGGKVEPRQSGIADEVGGFTAFEI